MLCRIAAGRRLTAPQLPPASETQTEVSKEAVAMLRIGGAEIEIYVGADTDLVEVLYRAVTYAQ